MSKLLSKIIDFSNRPHPVMWSIIILSMLASLILEYKMKAMLHDEQLQQESK